MTYGLYIHIPFCIKKCAYCDFVSTCAPEERQRAYFAALKQELKSCKGKQLDSVFLGGGTPSCVDARLIAALFDSINENMTVLPGAAITMEANPGTLTAEKLRIYRDCGINRISLGVQSLQERELRALGRIHSCLLYTSVLFFLGNIVSDRKKLFFFIVERGKVCRVYDFSNPCRKLV